MIVAAAGLALAACGQSAAPPAPTVSHLAIGPKGAMGVTAQVAMSVQALAPSLPGLDLVETEAEAEGQRFRMIAAKSGDEIVYSIAPTPDGTKVHSIATRSPLVVGPAGEIVFESAFADAPKAEIGYCGDEFVDGQPAFACSTAPDGVFWRVYLKIISDSAPESAELSQMTAEAKAQSPLVEMRWIAPR